MSLFRIICLILAVSFATETQAHAYTDPGTGALLWQALVGGFIGSMFYLRRMISWVKGKRRAWKTE